MPEIDGYEAIARMRKDMSLATMPILVLTSEEGPGVERRVLQLGADDYIMKPFNPDVLLSRVNAVFGRLKVVAAACDGCRSWCGSASISASAGASECSGATPFDRARVGPSAAPLDRRGRRGRVRHPGARPRAEADRFRARAQGRVPVQLREVHRVAARSRCGQARRWCCASPGSRAWPRRSKKPPPGGTSMVIR